VGNLLQGLYVLQLFDEKGGLVKTEKVVKQQQAVGSRFSAFINRFLAIARNDSLQFIKVIQ